MDELVAAARTGASGAAARLYHALAPMVRRYLRSRLPSEEDTEDLLQEVFISVFDSLPLYRGQASLKTWTLSIARHEVADWYRKRYVRRVVEKTSPLFEELVGELTGPEFELKKKRLEVKFAKTYRSLKSEYRDILSYRYELGMSVKEAAVRMKLSVKATESLLFRARTAFRLAYEQNGS